MTLKVPRVDHLVYVVPDLESGVLEMRSRLGVAPAAGGRHPGLGTHNALLSLGPETYLELIAPDPGQAPPPDGLVFDMDTRPGPGLRTWALRCEALGEGAARLRAAGVDPGAVLEGSRRRADGALLSWRLTDPRAMPLGGAVPFLIAWGGTPHPASSAPEAGALEAVRLQHPDPEAVRSALEAVGLAVGGGADAGARAGAVSPPSADRAALPIIDVVPGPRPAVSATLRTAAGRVTLEPG